MLRCLVRCLMPQSTSMVMLRWSVNLITLFLGKFTLFKRGQPVLILKRLTSTTVCVHALAALESTEENESRKYFMISNGVARTLKMLCT